jgi:PAS domain S-box-containing protein
MFLPCRSAAIKIKAAGKSGSFLVDPAIRLVYYGNRMFRVRLHAKFLILVLGSLCVFLGALSYLVVQREADLLARKAEDKQNLLSSTIYSGLKSNMMKGTPRSTLDLMDSIRGTYDLVKLEVLRRDGSRAFGIKGDRFTIPQLERTFVTGEETSFRENGPKPLHTILYPLKNDSECLGCHGRQKSILGVLLVSLSREDTIREIRASKRRLTLSLAALMALIGGMLYLAIRRIVLQPLAILHEGAERIGRGEFGHRINLSTDDEIQDLARSFNEMAGRIEESYAGLENKVRERTSQLSDAMEEVEDRAKRLYEFSRDMASVSRLSTKVFNAEQPLDQMLDHFMWAVDHGLGYKQTLLCIVDRKRIWLDVKRDSGLGGCLGITSQVLTGDTPFAALVRTGREVYVHDTGVDPVFSRPEGACASGPRSLYVIPILSGTRNKKCREEKNCIHTDCPAYQREDEQCWLVTGTFCGNALIESYPDKLAYCMTCDVFPVLGVLVVGDRSERPFKRRDVSVLRILAAEMGAALENHRLHGDNRQMVKQLLELHKLTASVLAELSLDRTLEAFIDSALKFSGLDACNFWLLSKDGRELTHRAGGWTGQEPEVPFCPDPIPLDAGVLGRAFRQNAIITEYNAVFSDPTPLGKASAAQGLLSLLAAPLKAEGRPIGVFSIHKKSRTPFLDTEIAAFMLFANHAAMAIDVCLLNEELKNQNRELTRNVNLVEGILASMSSGVMLLDLNGTVELVNEAGAKILQTRPKEIMNRQLTALAPQAAAFLSSSVGPYQEFELQREDGSSIPIGFSSAYCSGASGAREGIIVVYRDLTEIKALQAEVINKERFAAMGRVVAGVAHEIRNPLFGISSIGQIFEREFANPEHRELARALLSETRRLNQLVEELLIYGRPMKLMPVWCDLMQLWEEVIGMHRDEIEKKGIRIRCDLDIGHTRAYLDANQIRQVFLNLLRNAVDATPSGGDISIRLLLDDRHFIFRVTDTGVGVPAKNIDKIFDLFFTTKPRGTGLGLGICKKIVEDHGGEIFLESREWDWLEERRGTTVTVKLPYRGVSENTNVQASNNK